jgi:N-formylglutamate amidohydrolase
MIHTSIPKNPKMIISVPHSGVDYSGFEKNLKGNFKADVDFYIPSMLDIEELNKNGIGVIYTDIIRVVLDLNRTREQAFFHWDKNRFGEEIYISKPSIPLEVMDIYDEYYSLISSFDKDILFIDLHSMPSKTTDFHRVNNPTQDIDRPGFCISDIDRNIDFSKAIVDDLREMDYIVKLNDPYKGGNIVREMSNVYYNSVQIEINRSLYMMESTFEPIVSDLPKDLNNFLINLL